MGGCDGKGGVVRLAGRERGGHRVAKSYGESVRGVESRGYGGMVGRLVGATGAARRGKSSGGSLSPFDDQPLRSG